MLMMILVLFILALVGFLISEFSKKNIVFGVSLPLALVRHENVRKVKAWYYSWYTSLIIPLFGLAIYFASQQETLMIAFVIAWMVLLLTLFSMANKKMLKVKEALKLTYASQTIATNHHTTVLWDESKLRKHLFKAFIPNWVLIFSFALVTIVFYADIPSIIPMHFNASGAITRSADKTWLSVMLLPVISLLLTALVHFLMRFNLSAKKELDALSPEEDANRLYIAKERLNWFISFLMFSVTLLNMFIAFYSYGWITQNPSLMVYVPMAFTIVIIGSLLVYALSTGFSGDRLRPLSSDNQIIFKDDDNHWIMGMFYNNPDDPAIFVARRFGGGFTMNLGNTYGRLILIGILLIVAIVVIISSLAS